MYLHICITSQVFTCAFPHVTDIHSHFPAKDSSLDIETSQTDPCTVQSKLRLKYLEKRLWLTSETTAPWYLQKRPRAHRRYLEYFCCGMTLQVHKLCRNMLFRRRPRPAHPGCHCPRRCLSVSACWMGQCETTNCIPRPGSTFAKLQMSPTLKLQLENWRTCSHVGLIFPWVHVLWLCMYKSSRKTCFNLLSTCLNFCCYSRNFTLSDKLL